MSENLKSTVTYRSNLQPVVAETILEDKNFLRHIHDIFALEEMHKKNSEAMTVIQKDEYDKASLHCLYAFDDDYPWGTIVIDGEERVVCKCLNSECAYFKECRPDFVTEELEILAENANVAKQLAQKVFVAHTSENADGIAASNLFNSPPQKPEPSPVLSEPPSTPKVNPVSPISPVNAVSQVKAVSPTVLPIASFESFIPVEQGVIITAPANQRAIINAGPGTGKTYTLIEKIKFMLTEGDVLAENIMVLCFSRAAVEVIRSRLQAAAENDELPIEWQQVDVRTFDSFATAMIAWVRDNAQQLLPRHYSLDTQNYEQRICTARDILAHNNDMLAGYEHIIVDEVQDLVGFRAEMVLAMLKSLPETCGFTLLGDSCQSLYDYIAQDDPAIMSSTLFYQKLFENYRGAEYYALEHNYRQKDDFAGIAVPYRAAILSGDNVSMTCAVNKIRDALPTASVNIHHFGNENANNYLKKGSLGILTRTNAQALQISAWLRAENVPHALERPAVSSGLASWIVRVLCDTEDEVLTESSLEDAFTAQYPGVVCRPYWSVLAGTQHNSDRSYYEKEMLLRGLLENAKNPLLYAEPDKISCNIMVSNIHRAKGKEFDTVLVLDDVLSEPQDELEHKVCYVALTRPKKQLERIEFKHGDQFIYVSRDEQRRCFKSGLRGQYKILSHFEVGVPGDIDMRSFAMDRANQDYILNHLKPGDRLKLIKCKDTGSDVIYRLVPEDDFKHVLAYTTRAFSISMESAIQRIYNNSQPIKYQYFPDSFSEIYLDGFVTCISSEPLGEDATGTTNFNSMSVWMGLAVVGFAQSCRDRY